MIQVDGNTLLPSMNSTNSAPTGSREIGKQATFQAELDAATSKINGAKKSAIMTPEEVAQRNKDIKEASVQLEAIMLKMLYGEMWKTVPKDTFFGDGNAMEIYRDMHNEELTKKMAEGGGIGLADFIYKQLTETNPHRLV